MSFNPDRLETSLRDRLGDGLRSFWKYGHHGEVTVTYTRADLDESSVERRIERMVGLYLDEHHFLRDDDDAVLASLEGSVHMFDTVFAMHLPRPDGGGGVGFSIEPGVGRNLNAFLHECAEILTGE